MSNRLPIIAAEIAAEHRATARAHGEFVMHAIEAGKRLIEAKGLIPHGGWENWLGANVPEVSARTAQRYMRAAKQADKSDTVSFLTLKEITSGTARADIIAEQIAAIKSAWAEASPSAQQHFRDLVEIVGTSEPIPDGFLTLDSKLVRDTARSLRSIRAVRP